MQKETTRIQNAREGDVTLSRIKGIARSLKNCDFGITRATRADSPTTYFVTARRFEYEDLSKLAELLSGDDMLVSYIPHTNFLIVQNNPMPTPATIFPAISRIPATLDEALEICAKYYDDGIHAIDKVVNGKRQITVICSANRSRTILSELAFKLSHRGVRVQFFNNCNFLLASDCPVEEAIANTDLLTAVG